MDAHFDPDLAGENQPPKKRMAAVTVAISALVGVVGGVGAFGIANAINNDRQTPDAVTTSESLVADKDDNNAQGAGRPVTPEAPRSAVPTVSSLVPVTTAPRVTSRSTTTRTVTQSRRESSRDTVRTTVTASRTTDVAARDQQTPVRDDGPDARSQTRDTGGAQNTTSRQDRETQQVRANTGAVNAADMSVVPTPIERPVERTTVTTPTPQMVAAAAPTTAPTTTVQVRPTPAQPGAAPGAPQNTDGSRPGNGATTDANDTDRAAGQDRPTAPPVPAGPPPAPLMATNAELESVLRRATSPATQDKDRIALFEQGEAARPVMKRFMSLATGSVPLLGWNLQGPVQVIDGRAETRLRLHTLLPTPEYPAIFVWRDGAWRVSAETTCEMARALAMPCP